MSSHKAAAAHSEALPVPAATVNDDVLPSASAARPRALVPVVLFIALFGVILASFPARNVDVWRHFADGRDSIRRATFTSTWLYDLVTYGVFTVAGGTALAALKAATCGVIALLLLRLARLDRGWQIALAATGLAVLAMGSRLLLQPATVAVLLLAILLGILRGREKDGPATEGVWPDWRLVLLLAVWANVAGWLVIGLGVVVLTWIGELLDGPRPGGFVRALGCRAASIAILIVAACLSPSHINALRVPAEVRAGVTALRSGFTDQAVNSPFDPAYLSDFQTSPAALAYYPLLALGLFSFLLNRKEWRWSRFLPWFALAVVSGLQARAVPFFAVLAGPILAWNLQEAYAPDGASRPARRFIRYAVLISTILLATTFLACAWPGWLQGPPFEPRRWAIEQPTALVRGAEFIRRTRMANLWPAHERSLHAGPDSAAAFAWFDPEDHGVRDEAAIDQLLNIEDPDTVRQRLRDLGVSRIIAYVGDGRSSSAVLDRLLLEPNEWPVLHLAGGVVVFGWRDPARGAPDPYREWMVDFGRLAFRPDESEMAPAAHRAEQRPWWAAFREPAFPPRPPGRDEAIVLLRKAEALTRSAPFRHLIAWEVSQAAGLVGAAGGWGAAYAPIDAAVRLNLLRPPIPDDAPLPAITQVVFALNKQFTVDRGGAPVGIVYAAVRAARRAVAENPDDANAHLVLGRAYVVLANTTSERSWAERHPQLLSVRQIQASAAFNRALTLNPRLGQAHFELGKLYLTLNCLDLAAFHFQAFRNSPLRWGGPGPGDERGEAVAAELDRLNKALERARREYARESERTSVSDRAAMAMRRGLGGQARDLLLKSDVAAFGAAGTELELDLLLRTGRPANVLDWMTDEVRGSLSDDSYHWLRCRAMIALGDYDAADGELAVLIGSGGRLPEPGRVADEVGGLVGKAVLDEGTAGPYLPGIVWLALGRSDFRMRIAEITEKLALVADVTVLRGLIALESGNIPRAREAFRAALAYSPSRWGGGQLEFSSRRVAWDCLALIDSLPGP
jgi:tetratricopeptide (TPR) repeat protein